MSPNRVTKEASKLTLAPPRMWTIFSDYWQLNPGISARGMIISDSGFAPVLPPWTDLTSGFTSEESGWNRETGLWVEERFPKLLTEFSSHLIGLHGWCIPFVRLCAHVAGLPAPRWRKIGGSSIHDYVMGKRTVCFLLVCTDWERLFGLWICLWGLSMQIHWGRKVLTLHLLKGIQQVTSADSKVNWGWRFRTHKKEIEPTMPCTTPTKVLERSSWIIKVKNPLLGLSCFSIYLPLCSSTLRSPFPVIRWIFSPGQE